MCRETRLCPAGEDVKARSSPLYPITCLCALPEKPSSQVLSDQRQVGVRGTRQEGSANLRRAQCTCQGGCWRPNLLRRFVLPLLQPRCSWLTAGKRYDDFHLFLA